MANAKPEAQPQGLLIESALRTLESEAGGIAALIAAIQDGLAQPLAAAVPTAQSSVTMMTCRRS